MTYTIGHIEYHMRKHARAKQMTLSVHQDGRVTITIPKYATKREAHAFVYQRLQWIEEQLQKVEIRQTQSSWQFPEDTPAARKEARQIITQRLAELNQFYFGFVYGNISIRNMRTRWGSCSAEGNLSFSYKVAFLPDVLRDYVLVHELAHLKEMNHSPKFWELVERADSRYREHRKALRVLL